MLFLTLFLNLAVSIVKIAVGFATGLLNLVADGAHSLLDTLSNLVGIAAIAISGKPADERYPYGYSKFETGGVMIICIFLGIAFIEILHLAYDRLMNPIMPDFGTATVMLVAATIPVNIFVSWYEHKKSEELESDYLHGDAHHTLSDVGISISILVGLFLIKTYGRQMADLFIALVIAFLIGVAFLKNFKNAMAILCDARVIPEEEITDFVLSLDGVRFCHAVRSRGRPDAFFMDLHIGVDKDMTVEKTHDDVSHRIKLALKNRYPGLRSANIQTEPDTPEARSRIRSVFKDKDY